MAKPLLIVASSGRMLAEAAKSAGFAPLVVDLFADRDTHDYSEAVLQTTSLAAEALAPNIAALIERYAVREVIYGSGLENHPETLAFLDKHLSILGNTPEVFAKLHDKAFFFSHLSTLGIPFPESAFHAPDNPCGWLFKPMRGQGGLGIRFYDPNVESGCLGYWQKYQAGEPYSVLFIADGLRFDLIGFNRQWTINLGPGREFMFSGVSRCCALAQDIQTEVLRWLRAIVPAFGLQGLNSLDFMAARDGHPWALEINPRPTASMQLYDAELLRRHLHACRGLLLNVPKPHASLKTYQVLYAQQTITIPDNFEWPGGCRDLPKAGAKISKGQPICSMIACGNHAQPIGAMLKNNQRKLLNQLHSGS